MTPLLSLYLELERLMLVAESVDERTANVIRDAMDPIWYELTDRDRDMLDQRVVNSIRTLEGLRVPVSDHLYYLAPAPTGTRPIPEKPIQGWRKAA